MGRCPADKLAAKRNQAVSEDKTQAAPHADVAGLPFEAALKELEGIVARLERGDVPLEESIAIYTRGEALKARCDALVWNFSLFNQYARVATGYFGGNHVRFESLTARARARRLVGGAVRRVRA